MIDVSEETLGDRLTASDLRFLTSLSRVCDIFASCPGLRPNHGSVARTFRVAEVMPVRHHLAVTTKQAVFVRQAISQALKRAPDVWDREQRRELALVATALGVPERETVGQLVASGYVSVGDDGEMHLTERGQRAAADGV